MVAREAVVLSTEKVALESDRKAAENDHLTWPAENQGLNSPKDLAEKHHLNNITDNGEISLDDCQSRIFQYVQTEIVLDDLSYKSPS
jgi:hypothetical protein